MNLTDSDIKARELHGNEKIERAEYRKVDLPRGQRANAIFVQVAGEHTMRATNLLSVDDVDVWADVRLTRFSAWKDLNPAELKAYELANG